MNRKFLASAAAVALVAGTVTVLAAAPAEAHTPNVQVTCSTLDVNLSSYAASQPGQDAVAPVYNDWDQTVHHDAVGTPTIPNPNYVPAKDAVPPTTHKEYEFKQFITGKTKTNTDRWWNPGLGWYFDGNVIDVSNNDGKPAVPAQGTPTIPNPAYKPASDEVVHHHDLKTPGKDAVPAKANHATIVVDGVTQVNEDFSTSLHKTVTFDNKYVAHTWSVKVTAWDNAAYNVNQSGTTTPCAVPVVDAKTAASVVATCGAADVTITNPEQEWTDNKTGATTIWIDGKFKEAVSVAGDATETRHYTFAEDSGDHTVVVKNAEFAGGAVLAQATVHSDCILPQPEAKVTETEWVDSAITCDSADVTQTRTVTTTPYTLVEGEWVLDTENASSKQESRTRDLTADEQVSLATECAGTQPDAKVVLGDWTNGKYGCGDTTVDQTRTVTTTPYILSVLDRKWVLDTENAVEKTETQTVKLTAEQIKALNCAVVVTPTPKPTASTPAAAAPAKAAPAAPAKASAPVDVLASTGSNVQDIAPIFWLGGFLLLAGIGTAAGVSIFRNRKVAPVTTGDDE